MRICFKAITQASSRLSWWVSLRGQPFDFWSGQEIGGGGGEGVTCVFGKNTGLAVLRFQVAIVNWNSTRRQGIKQQGIYFVSIFLLVVFFNVASGGWGVGGGEVVTFIVQCSHRKSLSPSENILHLDPKNSWLFKCTPKIRRNGLINLILPKPTLSPPPQK